MVWGNWNEALVVWGKRDVVWHCQVRPPGPEVRPELDAALERTQCNPCSCDSAVPLPRGRTLTGFRPGASSSPRIPQLPSHVAAVGPCFGISHTRLLPRLRRTRCHLLAPSLLLWPRWQQQGRRCV